MCCRRLRNLGKYAIKFNILNFFRECRFPRLRNILDCVLSQCVFADYLIREGRTVPVWLRTCILYQLNIFLDFATISDAEYELRTSYARIV